VSRTPSAEQNPNLRSIFACCPVTTARTREQLSTIGRRLSFSSVKIDPGPRVKLLFSLGVSVCSTGMEQERGDWKTIWCTCRQIHPSLLVFSNPTNLPTNQPTNQPTLHPLHLFIASSKRCVGSMEVDGHSLSNRTDQSQIDFHGDDRRRFGCFPIL